MTSELEKLMNVGPSLSWHLREAGIETKEDLEEVGPIDAYLRVRNINPKVMGNKMALYAIYGALTDQNCIKLPQETKNWLNAELGKVLKDSRS